MLFDLADQRLLPLRLCHSRPQQSASATSTLQRFTIQTRWCQAVEHAEIFSQWVGWAGTLTASNRSPTSSSYISSTDNPGPSDAIDGLRPAKQRRAAIRLVCEAAVGACAIGAYVCCARCWPLQGVSIEYDHLWPHRLDHRNGMDRWVCRFSTLSAEMSATSFENFTLQQQHPHVGATVSKCSCRSISLCKQHDTSGSHQITCTHSRPKGSTHPRWPLAPAIARTHPSAARRRRCERNGKQMNR